MHESELMAKYRELNYGRTVVVARVNVLTPCGLGWRDTVSATEIPCGAPLTTFGSEDAEEVAQCYSELGFTVVRDF